MASTKPLDAIIERLGMRQKKREEAKELLKTFEDRAKGINKKVRRNAKPTRTLDNRPAKSKRDTN